MWINNTTAIPTVEWGCKKPTNLALFIASLCAGPSQLTDWRLNFWGPCALELPLIKITRDDEKSLHIFSCFSDSSSDGVWEAGSPWISYQSISIPISFHELHLSIFASISRSDYVDPSNTHHVLKRFKRHLLYWFLTGEWGVNRLTLSVRRSQLLPQIVRYNVSTHLVSLSDIKTRIAIDCQNSYVKIIWKLSFGKWRLCFFLLRLFIFKGPRGKNQLNNSQRQNETTSEKIWKKKEKRNCWYISLKFVYL